MRQLRGFAPWITYPFAAAIVDWRIAAALAALVALATAVRGRPSADSDVFAVTAAVFFPALTAVAVVAPSSGLHRFVGALTPAALAVGAIVSIARRQPFTIPYARRVAPAEFWDTPVFMHINAVLSGVWATSFALMAAVIATVVAVHPEATGIILFTQVAGFVIPMRISRRYPASVRSRIATA